MGCCQNAESVEYDPEGIFTLTKAMGKEAVPNIVTPQVIWGGGTIPPVIYKNPCSLATLNGSWSIHFTRKYFPAIIPRIRGPMRIEATPARIRISGDVYVNRGLLPTGLQHEAVAFEPFTASSLVIGENWYPHLPFNEYRWYFRSLGVSYSGGLLDYRFERHLWDVNTEEFVQTDIGWMRFKCETWPVVGHFLPRSTFSMSGEAMVGGILYDVVAYKTSPFFRGCHVEVDVMQNRSWPAAAGNCAGNQTFTFAGVYRAAGLDISSGVSSTAIPDDPTLTAVELHNLLAAHRDIPVIGSTWRLWLLVGSDMGDGTFGIMFDDVPPHREGAAGFFDPTLPNNSNIETSARGRHLGEVPLAFLRTLIHEIGHSFNLFHPKHDVHGVPVGTTIMNQTGDVIGFATSTNPYPCNATFGFDDHNITSLIHSPDPQVAPGWKKFGWGHGSAWSGLPEPVDATGLDTLAPSALDLKLDVEVPNEIVRGEFVTAKVTLTNTGDSLHRVTTALNLSEGDLRITLKDPSDNVYDVRDIVVICAVRRMTDLPPSEAIEADLQLFYTNKGLTFDHLGHYVLQATLHTADDEGTVVTSLPVDLIVRPSVTEQEREIEQLSTQPEVGRSFALGDFGVSTDARNKLEKMQTKYGRTPTGTAASLVLANSLARDFRNLKTGAIIRKADETKANKSLEIATQNKDAFTVARMATTIVVPREKTPLLDKVKTRIKKAARGRYKKEDAERADRLLSDTFAKTKR
jgi:hypothetical protein